MTRKSLGILLAIFAVSVTLRVGTAFYLGDIVDAPPLLTDQRSYHALGERLITGHGFSFGDGWYPFTEPDTPTAHWSFLYSLFVAGVYAIFGPHPLAVRVIQAILGGILLPWLVYRLTFRLYQPASYNRFGQALADRGFSQERLALLAAGIAAVYFYFILYAATLMTETFFLCGLLFILERTMVLAETPTWRHGLILGLGFGLTTLLRQSILPGIVVMAIWLLWVGYRRQTLRRTLASLAVSMGVLAVFIAPFTVRNYLAYQEFLLLNSNAGYAMFSAQHPMHGVNFRAFEGAPIPTDLIGLGLNEAQFDRELMKRGIEFVLAEPGRYLQLSLSRAVAYIEFWPTPDTADINNIGRVGSFGLFLPFMLYGLFVAVRQALRRAAQVQLTTAPLMLCLLFGLAYSVLHIFTWAMPRYRLPVDAVMLSFAALGLDQILRWLGERFNRRKPLLTAESR
ncbi:hypothetical protein TFLX_06448 [Thermoflexales bacterium]|nr:hypothetical protein TFLX_06448 [Thermoflexales bacterium]